ncbi:MAG: hypothetical protein AAGE52_37970, partial [Myxococcota bacterium]
ANGANAPSLHSPRQHPRADRSTHVRKLQPTYFMDIGTAWTTAWTKSKPTCFIDIASRKATAPVHRGVIAAWTKSKPTCFIDIGRGVIALTTNPNANVNKTGGL